MANFNLSNIPFKDTARDGVVGLLGIGVYSKAIKPTLSTLVGKYAGKYGGAVSAYVTALAARKFVDGDDGRIAAGAIFGEGLAVLFGVNDPGYSMVSGANRPAASRGFQGLGPVMLTPQVTGG